MQGIDKKALSVIWKLAKVGAVALVVGLIWAVVTAIGLIFK